LVENGPLTNAGDFYNPITGESWDVIGGKGFDDPTWDSGEFFKSLLEHVAKYDNVLLDFSGASETQIGEVVQAIADNPELAAALADGAICVVGL
jgi:hypothetical protein